MQHSSSDAATKPAANPGARSMFAGVRPSPTVPALPGLPVLGSLLAFRKDRMGIHDDAALLGPIVRFSLVNIPIYTISDADLAHDVLVTQAGKMAKSAGLQFLNPLLGQGLLTAEGDVHKRHRKLLAPAFAPKRLAAYAEVMVEETRKTCERWGARPQLLDLSHEMMEMTLAIAGRTLFGADVRGDAHTVGVGLEMAMRSVISSLTSPVQLGYEWPLPRHVRMRRAVKMLDEVVYRLIADGRRADADRGDVLSMLLLAQDEAGGMTDREVRDEVMTLLLAGHETTANALSWTWYELGRNPAALARLTAEIDEVVGTRPVTADDLPKLPWTAAVLDEAMRLHPPAYQVGREVAESLELGGHTLPAGSILVVNIRGIHRRASYYAAPLAFRPERMLPDEKKARPRHHYLPFGAGPRVCIGQHFALMEAQLALATMVQHGVVHTIASRVLPEPLITLRPKGGLPARVSRRIAN